MTMVPTPGANDACLKAAVRTVLHSPNVACLNAAVRTVLHSPNVYYCPPTLFEVGVL